MLTLITLPDLPLCSEFLQRMREDTDQPRKFGGFKVKSVSDAAFKWAVAVAEKMVYCVCRTIAFLSNVCEVLAMFCTF